MIKKVYRIKKVYMINSIPVKYFILFLILDLDQIVLIVVYSQIISFQNLKKILPVLRVKYMFNNPYQ